jgi:hypothetical protein
MRRLIIEEEVKIESPNQDDKQKFVRNDRNDAVNEADLASNMSTARVSQNLFEFKSRTVPVT